MDDRIRDILEFQFNLEILLRKREQRIIRDEIYRGEEILKCLQQLLVFGTFSLTSDFVSDDISSMAIPTRSSSRAETTPTMRKSMSFGPKHIFECKADGSFVK